MKNKNILLNAVKTITENFPQCEVIYTYHRKKCYVYIDKVTSTEWELLKEIDKEINSQITNHKYEFKIFTSRIN